MKHAKQSFSCKLCGKGGFKSAVAVYGHMRCHSKKKTGGMILKSCVKTDLFIQVSRSRKKRSGGRCRIKTSGSNNLSWCNMNTSSCCCSDDDDSVVDDELLDIAASLLMLSKGGFCSDAVDHVSDNARIDCGFVADSVDDDHVDGLRSGCDSFKENYSEEINCGLSENKAEIVEFGPVSDAEVQSELCDAEIKVVRAAIGVVLGDEVVYKAGDRVFVESNARTCPAANVDSIQSCGAADRGTVSELSDAEIGDETSGVNRVDAMVDGLSSKRCDHVIEEGKNGNVGVADKCSAGAAEQTTDDDSCFEKCQKFVCSNCSKSFLSYQSLGGHSVHCRRLCSVKIEAQMSASTKGDITLREKQGVVEDEDSNSKKRWKHECAVCCKTFPTGRALGGHMRAHYKGKVKSNQAENLACDKEGLGAAIDEEIKEQKTDADGVRFSVAAVIEERKQQEYADACSKAANNVQQLLQEQQMVIIPQGNIPLLV